MCFYILAVVSNQSSLTRCVLALEGFPAPDRGGRTQPGGDSRTDSQQRRLAFPLALPQLIPDLPPRQDPEPQPGRGGGKGRGGAGEAPPAAPRARNGRLAPRPPQTPQRTLTPALSQGEPPGEGRESPAATGGCGRPRLRRPGRGSESRGRPSGGSHPPPRRRGSTHLLGSAGRP